MLFLSYFFASSYRVFKNERGRKTEKSESETTHRAVRACSPPLKRIESLSSRKRIKRDGRVSVLFLFRKMTDFFLHFVVRKSFNWEIFSVSVEENCFFFTTYQFSWLNFIGKAIVATTNVGQSWNMWCDDMNFWRILMHFNDAFNQLSGI